MNLKSFEEDFDTKILKRGKNYYHDGAVLSIEKISENEYAAEVDGSEIYEVTVEMDNNGDIYNLSCDCPYDMGEYCKHEAAVLYALRDKNVKIIKTAVNNSTLPQLLGKCNTLQTAKKFSIECDSELAVKIAADFRELYRRKPAFMDELTKAGF